MHRIARAASTRIAEYIVLLSYALALGGVGALMLVADRALVREREDHGWVLHSGQSIAQLKRLQVQIVELESAGRAFLITEGEQWLTQYRDQRRTVAQAVQSITSAHASAEHQLRVQQLLALIDRRFGWLDEQVARRQQGAALSGLAAASAREIAEMVAINDLVEQLARSEYALLHQSVRMREDAQQHAARLLRITGLLGGLLVTGVFIYAQRLWRARRAAELAAVHMAHHDALTNLPNRRLLHDRLATAIAHAGRAQEQLAVLYIDLDGFKRVNDTLGHRAGDELLMETARRLTGMLRAGDTIARIGGDEFVAVLIGRNSAGFRHVADKIAAAIGVPYRLSHGTVHCTASMGMAVYPHDAQTAEELLSSADRAMYDAKGAGRACVRTGGRAAPGAALLRKQG